MSCVPFLLLTSLVPFVPNSVCDSRDRGQQRFRRRCAGALSPGNRLDSGVGEIVQTDFPRGYSFC